MSVTRKHMVEVAEIVATFRSTLPADRLADADYLANELALFFQRHNRNTDRQRFLDAAGYGDAVNPDHVENRQAVGLIHSQGVSA